MGCFYFCPTRSAERFLFTFVYAELRVLCLSKQFMSSTARAIQVAQSIQIRNCKRLFEAELIDADTDKLFFRQGKDRYLYLFRYGVVGFFNIDEVEQQQLIERLKPYTTGFLEEPMIEEIMVEQSNTVNKVFFDRVLVPGFSPEIIQIIIINLAQSVVLDNYSQITEEILEDTRRYTRLLEERGKLNLRGNRLIRYIAKVLNVKNRVSENLDILDNSDLTWENEYLNRLDVELKINFDLKDRHRFMEDQLEIVKENLDLFKDLMQHRESTNLEWIIIILILIEIIDAFWIRLR